MRIAAPDVLLFGIGLLLVAGSAYALYLQGGVDALSGGSPTSVFNVDYQTSTVELAKENVANFASASPTFNVNQTNVAKILVTIACADPVPGSSFNLQVLVEGPNGLKSDRRAGACGSSLVVEVDVAQRPDPTVAQGRTVEEARASLDERADANSTLAVGEWKVTVNGARGPGLPGLPAGNPSGTITLSADVWEPRFAAIPK